jgi:L-rhamnose mutarotase
MTTERFLIRRILKPESVVEYVRYHQNVPQELMEIYRENGVVDLSCFLCENDLVVYIEVDPEIYRKNQEAISTSKVDAEWQSLMATLNEPDFKPLEFREVFRM